MHPSAILLIVSCALACGVGCSSTPRVTAPSDRVYLATYFLDNGQDGVYLAASEDALRFEPIVSPNVPILKPEIGKERLTRDACLLRGPDSTWHMTWTTGWWENGFGIAHSTDLVNWSAQNYVQPMSDQPGAVNCWAPEIAFDPARGEYLLFWSSTVLGAFPETEAAGDDGPDHQKCNHRIYSTTTKDFITFTPERLYYNPGFNCIDATLLAPNAPGAAWHLFFKDETRYPPSKNIRHLAITDPLKAAGKPSEPITGAYWAEGPSAIRIDGKVRVFFDRYADNRFGAVESPDFEHWTDISDRISFPKDARHTTVVEVDRATLESVRRAIQHRRVDADQPRPAPEPPE